jgi:hypothetical protein
MTPLQALIIERMREKGWDPPDVEARGVKHATLHRYMNPVHLQQLPRKSVLRDLANALELDVDDVRQAAMDSIAGVGDRPWRRTLRKSGETIEWEIVVTRRDRLPLDDLDFWHTLREVERELSPDLIESFQEAVAREHYAPAAREGTSDLPPPVGEDGA